MIKGDISNGFIKFICINIVFDAKDIIFQVKLTVDMLNP